MPSARVEHSVIDRRRRRHLLGQTSGDQGPPRKPHVFISYSRKDSALAEKLRLALIALNFEAYLDKEDILPGEPWRARLESLILAADAVVYVISPDSITSEH